MKRVNLPGSWYYTEDPPATWRLVLYWVITLLYMFWPFWASILAVVLIENYSS